MRATMKIKAFKGLRPVKDKAADIASLPYDVVNFEQAAEQAKGKPLSFMRVVRSEIELPAGTDPYSDAVYAHAKENFEKLVADGREGINGLMISNAMHLSSWTGKPVSLPFDEELFRKELFKRVKNSRRKG